MTAKTVSDVLNVNKAQTSCLLVQQSICAFILYPIPSTLDLQRFPTNSLSNRSFCVTETGIAYILSVYPT